MKNALVLASVVLASPALGQTEASCEEQLELYGTEHHSTEAETVRLAEDGLCEATGFVSGSFWGDETADLVRWSFSDGILFGLAAGDLGAEHLKLSVRGYTGGLFASAGTIDLDMVFLADGPAGTFELEMPHFEYASETAVFRFSVSGTAELPDGVVMTDPGAGDEFVITGVEFTYSATGDCTVANQGWAEFLTEFEGDFAAPHAVVDALPDASFDAETKAVLRRLLNQGEEGNSAECLPAVSVNLTGEPVELPDDFAALVDLDTARSAEIWEGTRVVIRQIDG